MTGDLSPAVVAERLARLRASWRPMTAAEARVLLTSRRSESFEVAASRRLRELRALLDLGRHLRGALRGARPAGA